MTTIAELQIKVDTTQVDQAQTKLKGLATATKEAASAEDQAAKSKQNSSTATDKLLSQIDRETRSLKQLADQQRQLTAARDSGSLTGEQYSKYNAIIQQNIANVKQRGTVVEQQNKKELQATKAAIEAENQRLQDWLKSADERARSEEKAQQRIKNARAEKAKQDNAEYINRQIQQEKDLAKAENERYQATLRSYSAAARAEKEAETARRASARAIDQEKRSLDNLLASIDPTTRELQRLNDLEKQLNIQRSKGNISGDQYQKYAASIDRARQSANRFNTDLNRTGLTAKQVDAAMRGLPAQFTDIVVSLQGGQAPLTVLLQQGGQIKDMFGGILPAIKAVGTGLMGLVNIYTLSAVGIGALAAAWYSGTAQLESLNKAIITSGNVSRVSAQEIRDYAAAAAEVGNTSVSSNVEAITKLVSASKLVPSTFEEISAAATSWSQATGAAIGDVIDDFNTLGKDPVQAAVKLNEQYHFLTAATLEQAEAFVRQGKEQEATRILTVELATTMEAKAKRMAESANIVTKAWVGVKNAISDAWEAAGEKLSDTPQAQLRAINAEIAKFESKSRNPTGFTEYQNLIDKRTELVQAIYEQRTAEEQEGITRAREEKRIAASVSLMADQKAAMDGVQKAQQKIVEWKAKEGVLDDKKFKEGLKFYEDQLKKAQETAAKKGQGPKILDDTDVNDLKNKTTEITATYKKMFADIDAAQKSGTLSPQAAFQQRVDLLNKEKAAVTQSYQAQIAEMEKLKGAATTTAAQRVALDRRISDARTQMVKAQTDLDTQLTKLQGNESERVAKQKLIVDEYERNAQRMVDNIAKQGERARAALGMSDRQSSLFSELNSEDDRFQAERDRLNAARSQPDADQGTIDKQIKAAEEAHNQATATILSNYDKMGKAQGDWVTGAKKSWSQFVEDASNVAGATEQLFSSAFNGLTSTLTDFIMEGKANFADFTKSILADLTQILIRMALVNAVSGIFGGAGAATVPQAKGGAWSNGVQMFAKGGAFTNSVVSRPTAFATSTGLGVMGEAGEEAIMPLTRTSDGSLGVKAQLSAQQSPSSFGAGGAGVVVYVNIDNQGNTETSATDSDYNDFGKDIGDFVDQRYQRLLTRDLSPGGAIWKSQQGRM